MNLKEDDIVLCTVKKIERTTVFLDVEGGIQGSMVFSEVSPGRIRNIREFIVPGKKVVCKVLRIRSGHPEFSLRRVTAKEREEILEKNKTEGIVTKILKTVIKDKTPRVLIHIKEKYDLSDFLEEAREKPQILENFVSKDEAEQLKKILAAAKNIKEKSVKKTLTIKSSSSSGLNDIKSALTTEDAKINYKGSSKFSVEVKSNDFKTANAKLEEVLEKIKAKAKKLDLFLEIK